MKSLTTKHSCWRLPEFLPQDHILSMALMLGAGKNTPVSSSLISSYLHSLLDHSCLSDLHGCFAALWLKSRIFKTLTRLPHGMVPFHGLLFIQVFLASWNHATTSDDVGVLCRDTEGSLASHLLQRTSRMLRWALRDVNKMSAAT